MRTIKANDFTSAFKQFTGGYWCKLIVPGECWTIRPDGSIAGVQPAPMTGANSTGIYDQ